MSKEKNEKDKQPSLFGISMTTTNEDSNKGAELFGLSMAPMQNSNDSTYTNPATFQILNLLELTSQKNIFDQADINVFREATRLLTLSEISRLRPNISPAFLDNLAKKATESEKNQSLENNKNIESDNYKNNQTENNKNIELLSKEEIDNYMAKFLKERNDLTKNLEEKNNQLVIDKNNEQNEATKK